MGFSRTDRRIGIITLIVLVISFSCLGRAGADDLHKAEEIINTLDKTLVSVMKEAKQLGYKGRYEILKPVIEDTFDFRTITRYSVGRLWKTFNEDQRKELTEKFTVLSISTYAARFDGYGGEKFRVVSSKPLKRSRLLVRSELTKADGEVIHMDYVLKKRGTQWRVINVVVNGVSDLSLKRAQYTYILRKKNYNGLIRKLDKKIAAYEEE